MLHKLQTLCDSPTVAPALGLGLMLVLNVTPHMNSGQSCFHFLVALALTLAATAVLFRLRPQGTRAYRPAPVVAAVLVLLGIVLDTAETEAGLAHVVGTVSSGIGSAYLYCRWFMTFCALSLKGALRQLMLAFSFSALAKMLVTQLFDVSPVAVRCVLALCIAASTACLYAAGRKLENGHAHRSLNEQAITSPSLGAGGAGAGGKTAPRLERPAATCALVAVELAAYGLLFGFLRTDLLGWVFTTNSREIGQVAQAIVPLLLFACLLLPANDRRRSALLRGTLLVASAVLLGTIFIAGLVVPTLSVVMFVLRCLISVFIYMRLFELAFRFGTHPCVTYGVGRAWFGAAFVVGLLVYNATLAHLAVDELPINAIFFGMSCVILLLLNSFSNAAVFSNVLAEEPAHPARQAKPLDLEEQCRRTAVRHGLSERESDVLLFTCEGLSKKEIAERMCISEDTVRYHTKQLYRKLDIHNRQELMVAVLATREEA